MSEMTAVHICPRCSSRDITRVPRRRMLDRMVRLLGWGVYRCYRCDRRFYDRPLDRKAS